MYPAVQRQIAVSAYFTRKHILTFGFAEQYDFLKTVGKCDKNI